MKQQTRIIFAAIILGCFGLPAFAQQAPSATPSPSITPPQKAEMARPPQPVIPGGEQKRPDIKTEAKEPTNYQTTAPPQVINDPQPKITATAPPPASAKPGPKTAPLPAKEQ